MWGLNIYLCVWSTIPHKWLRLRLTATQVYKRKHRIDCCTPSKSLCLTVWQPMRTHLFQIRKVTIRAHQYGVVVVLVGSSKGALTLSTNLTCLRPQRVFQIQEIGSSCIYTHLENKNTHPHVFCLYRTKSFGISTSFTVRKHPTQKEEVINYAFRKCNKYAYMHTCLAPEKWTGENFLSHFYSYLCLVGWLFCELHLNWKLHSCTVSAHFFVVFHRVPSRLSFYLSSSLILYLPHA